MDDLLTLTDKYEVLNHTPVGVCIVDHNYHILFWNNRLEEWTQIDKENVFNQDMRKVFPHLNDPRYLSRINSIFDGGTPTIFSSQLHMHVFPAKLPDGNDRIQHTTVTAIPGLNGSGNYACFVVEDVTELTHRMREYIKMRDKAVEDNNQREKAELALRESEVLLRAFMSSATECFILCDNEFQILEINQAAISLFKLQDSEIQNQKTLLLTDLLKSFQGETKRSNLIQVMESGTPVSDELIIYDEDGKEISLSVNVFKVNNGLGIIAEDITEKKKSREKLEYTLKELQRSNHELEQFGYIVSHDLQEPLRMVSSYVQLLGRKYKGKLDDDADDFIQFASDGADRMNKLIKDLLSYSRFSSQGKPFQMTDLNKILQNVKSDLQIIIDEKSVVIESDDLPVLMADATQMHQVFFHLISNAIKFCKRKKPKIQIYIDNKHEEWILEFKDNGIGIPEKDTGRIFGIFQKLESDTGNESDSTGIGLTICKKIVERHGGRIYVKSELGNGTSFFIAIPNLQGGGIHAAC